MCTRQVVADLGLRPGLVPAVEAASADEPVILAIEDPPSDASVLKVVRDDCDDLGILLCELHVLENQEALGEAAEAFCDNEETVRKFAEKARAIVEVLRE